MPGAGKWIDRYIMYVNNSEFVIEFYVKELVAITNLYVALYIEKINFYGV